MKKLYVLKQYQRLLYLPILTIGFSYARTKRWALIGFFSAMALTALLSLGLYFGIFKSTKLHYDDVFLNHIITGFFMSFAALLSLFHAVNIKGRAKLIYLLLFCLFTFHTLFINLGRSGYVIYFLMLGLYIWMSLPWKQGLAGFLILLGIAIFSYTTIPSMKQGINKVISDYKYYNQDKNTSVGYRLQFHHYSLELFKRHPWLGNGSASLYALSSQENPVPTYGVIDEPHGMYWFVAAEFGLLGLIALFGFFINLVLQATSLIKMRVPALIFIIAFMVINISDSLLYYSGSGFLFILFSAWYLSDSLFILNKKDSVLNQAQLVVSS